MVIKLKNEFYGITSLLFTTCAAIIGLFAIVTVTVEWAIIYLLILVISPIGVLLSYCAKCRCNSTCSHVFPGLVVKYLPQREHTGYTKIDIAIMALSIALILLFPQIWLIRNPPLLIMFWSLISIGFIMIQLKVCPSCKNTICALCSAEKV